jgi:hypothetical protein
MTQENGTVQVEMTQEERDKFDRFIKTDANRKAYNRARTLSIQELINNHKPEFDQLMEKHKASNS